jgi:AcrR family transcriptional regulator
MARRKAITDETVLAAAARVMFAKGPADFTLADVAAEAGIAPATLVQRFGDKRGLVVAAIAQDNAVFARDMRGMPAARGVEAVIDVFQAMFPDIEAASAGGFADQLLWLRQDMRDPDLNRLARERFVVLRAVVAGRMPRLRIPAAEAARLVEAQWQGALLQWGLEPQGRLADFVASTLRAWFSLIDLDPA